MLRQHRRHTDEYSLLYGEFCCGTVIAVAPCEDPITLKQEQLSDARAKTETAFASMTAPACLLLLR